MAAKSRPKTPKPPTSASAESFVSELGYAGDRADLARRIERLWDHLGTKALEDDDVQLIGIGRAAKKNFAQRFSTSIAQKIADLLRPKFAGIKPDIDGRWQESLSAGARGLKKLDVNYSTPRSGLELAVSVKTINFKDLATGRYTKNAKRVDGELRAEAQDCHTRQPYAVLAAFIFLPIDAASDSKDGPSSLKHIARIIAQRSGRERRDGDVSLFELAFIALYQDTGEVVCFSADGEVPDRGVPPATLTFSEALSRITRLHQQRNS